MSGLREKIADAIAGAVSQDDRYLEHADAVLRVLAEHGDTQQVREQVEWAVSDAAFAKGLKLTDRGVADNADAVMAVVAPIVAARDAAAERADEAHQRERALDARWQERWRDECDRADRAEADLAAARQQLEQVRAGIAQAIEKHAEEQGDPADNAYEYARIARQFDAPARAAGHDKSGQ